MIFETIQTEAISAGAGFGACVVQFIAAAASVFFARFWPFPRRKRRKARAVDYIVGGLLFIGFGAFFVFLSTLR